MPGTTQRHEALFANRRQTDPGCAVDGVMWTVDARVVNVPLVTDFDSVGVIKDHAGVPGSVGPRLMSEGLSDKRLKNRPLWLMARCVSINPAFKR